MPSIRFQNGRRLAVANIYCIGRNFAAHAAELGNAIEPAPVVFLKPTSALLAEDQAIVLPSFSNEVHYEAELVVAMGTGGRNIARQAALRHVAGYGLGLDLTARDIQNAAKQKGLPWTLGKGFAGAACISQLIDAQQLAEPHLAQFSLDVNGRRAQNGDCQRMIHDIPALIEYLSAQFGLLAGDLIYTGTPEGVAALQSGDHLHLSLGELLNAHFEVAR